MAFRFLAYLLFLPVLLILAGFTRLETSNELEVRLATLDGADFCSGTIIDAKKNYIVTAAHCAAEMRQGVMVKVELPNGTFFYRFKNVFRPVLIRQNRTNDEGDLYTIIETRASFVAWDEVYDVAILRFENKDGLFTKAATLSTNKVRYGDKVFHVGMPVAIWGTISEGIITKPKLGVTQSIPPFIPTDAIVHTAYMNRGSSGGGLFNDQGELIGITNWGIAGGPYLASRVIHVIDLLKKIAAPDAKPVATE